MKEFLEFLEQNEEAKAKIAELDANPNAKPEDYIAAAKEYGFEIEESDFVKTELSDDELDTVAGGKGCICAFGGGGTGDGKYTWGEYRVEGNESTCACVLGGGGEYVLDGVKYCRCTCVMTGFGADSGSCEGGNGQDEGWAFE